MVGQARDRVGVRTVGTFFSKLNAGDRIQRNWNPGQDDPESGIKPASGCLEFVPKKFKQNVADEPGYDGDFKIGRSKDIPKRPGDAPLLSHAGALEFSHQEIGIEQKDDKTYFNHRSADIFLHVAIVPPQLWP